MLRALAMILAHNPDDLGRVLAAAEAVRPGVTDILVAAFEAEAGHLSALAEHAWAGANRLRAFTETASEPDRPGDSIPEEV